MYFFIINWEDGTVLLAIGDVLTRHSLGIIYTMHSTIDIYDAGQLLGGN
jgi:hypothetical protein